MLTRATELEPPVIAILSVVFSFRNNFHSNRLILSSFPKYLIESSRNLAKRVEFNKVTLAKAFENWRARCQTISSPSNERFGKLICFL